MPAKRTAARSRRGVWPRRTRRVCGCAAASLAVYAGWLLLGPPDPRISTGVAVLVTIAAWAAAVAVARAAVGPLRAPWAAVAIATAGGAVGIAVWAGSRLLGWAAVPPWVYMAYLVFPLGLGVAALLFSGTRSIHYRTVLDGVIMGASLLIVSWLLVLRHIYADSQRGYDLVLSLAYPITDIVALTVAAAVLVRATRGLRPTLTLLTVGLLCMAAVEAVFAYATLGGDPIRDQLFELGWTAGMTAVLLAAVTGGQAEFEQRPGESIGWASVLLPYGPVTMAVTVMAIQPFSVAREAPVLAAGLVLAPAVLLRQIAAVAETNRLLAAVTAAALHDPLTGLANRSLFAQRLTEMLDDGDVDGRSAAVIVIDLDGFKAVNDAYGHAVGDDLLVAVADRLRAGVDDATTVARQGGDEFAVLTRTSPEQAERMVERLRTSFDTPFVIDGRRFLIRAGFGLAVADRTRPDAQDLVKRADLNMYLSKRTRPSAPPGAVRGTMSEWPDSTTTPSTPPSAM